MIAISKAILNGFIGVNLSMNSNERNGKITGADDFCLTAVNESNGSGFWKIKDSLIALLIKSNCGIIEQKCILFREILDKIMEMG